MKKQLALVALLGLILPITGHSQTPSPVATNAAPITWTPAAVSVNVAGDATETSYEFKGKNTSDKTVLITKVNKSCGCQSVEQSADKLEPGEEITLKGKITLKPYQGTQVKQLTVLTEPGPPQILTVNVIAPEGVKVTPDNLTWEAEDMTEKTALVSIPPGNNSTIGAISLLGGGYTMKEEKKGSDTLITVTPTGDSARAAIRVLTTTNGAEFPHYIRLEKRPKVGEQQKPQIPTPQAAIPQTQPSQSPVVQGLGSRAAKLNEAKLMLIEVINKISEAENAQ